MKETMSRAMFWIYSLTYGPNPGMQPFNLRHINGSGLGGSYLDTLMPSWLATRQRLGSTWTTLRQSSSAWLVGRLSRFRQYPARHRDAHGSRQTYAGRTAIRAGREAAWHNWQAFLDMRTSGDIGVATFPAVGSRAYRRLAPSVLNRETKELIRAYTPKDWLD